MFDLDDERADELDRTRALDITDELVVGVGERGCNELVLRELLMPLGGVNGDVRCEACVSAYLVVGLSPCVPMSSSSRQSGVGV